MPFTEDTPLTINVTTADIAAAGSSSTTNSLATALRRLGNAKQLPGQENDTAIQSCSFYAEINPRLQNGMVISACDAYVCSRPYSADVNTTLIILLELLGIKPQNAYTATLVHG